VRTFSALRAECSYPELIDLAVPKTARRQQALDAGTEFHGAVESWVKGERQAMLESKDARAWLARMERVWSPPSGCRAEVALGLDVAGKAYEVDEPEPHVYVPRAPGIHLVTAGRLDLLWDDSDEDGVTLHVVDVKTGRTYLGDPWDVPQLVAQAVAAASLRDQRADSPRWLRLGVYYARLGLFDYGVGRVDLEDVLGRFDDVKRWATQGSDPRPGGWCLGCWSRANCDRNPEAAA
jgi:hypothetical protein